jgi:hypothetical protein
MSDDLSVDEDAQDLALPAAEVTVRRRQTGGADVLTVVATFALVPFVQAVVSAFGAKLADAIDTSTRNAVRRLLRRVYDPPEGRDAIVQRRVSVALSDVDSGTRVSLDSNLPAEAVAQLVRMAAHTGAVGPGTVYWEPAGDPDGRWYVDSDGRVMSLWDREAACWQAVE